MFLKFLRKSFKFSLQGLIRKIMLFPSIFRNLLMHNKLCQLNQTDQEMNQPGGKPGKNNEVSTHQNCPAQMFRGTEKRLNHHGPLRQ